MNKIISFLNEYAPLENSQSWDNTGLLIDSKSTDSTILLTIDVTPKVIDECIALNTKNIISYHPVIFRPIKEINFELSNIIQNQISIFSIHTALDKRMCEYLANQLNCKISILENCYAVCENNNTLGYYLSKCIAMTGNSAMRYVMAYNHNFIHKPKSIIIGVGSAQSIFKDLITDSLIITGEMSHHDMLFYKKNNCSVILMEHSNCERIYLNQLANDLKDAGLESIISKSDVDPVEFYLK